MSLIDVAVGLAVLGGAVLQSSIGFGFALVCAPLLFAATTPERAIGLLLLLGFAVNVLTVVGERRRPEPLTRDIELLLAWSLPGMVAGLFVLRHASSEAIQLLITVAVFVSLSVQRWAVRHQPPRGGIRAPAWWAPPLAGLSTGALTTSTSTAGPPIVLYLLGRGAPPARVRDSLTVAFLALSVLGAAVLAISRTGEAAPRLGTTAALLPLVVIGHLAGRRVFARLATGHYERVLTVTLSASAIVGLLYALL